MVKKVEYAKKLVYLSNQWYNDGLKKANIRDLSGAITSLRKSLQYNRDNIASRNLLGLVYYGRGEVAEALVEWIISKNIKTHGNIANYFINYMVSRVMIDPAGTKPQTAIIEPSAMIGRLFEENRMHWGIFIALLCILFFYFYLWRMRSGFEVRVVGLNADAAKYAGIKDRKKILEAMFISGAFAGLAGTIELLSVHQRMYMNFASGYGFDGISVALLGQNSPLGILLSSFLFGSLRAGSNVMQMNTNVPSAMVSMIQALVILFIVGSSYFSNLMAKRRILKQARRDK